MRRSWVLLLMSVVAGCTALNAAYGEPDDGGGTSTGTGGKGGTSTTSIPLPDTSTTAVTSSTDGEDSGTVPVDLGDGDADTGIGSSTTGSPHLCSSDVTITEDAFLVSCGGMCTGANFGATASRGIHEGGHLLLRLPSSETTAVEVILTVTVVAQPALSDGNFELTAHAVAPPCEWLPGSQLGMPPMAGESAVTWALCDSANPNSAWGDEAFSALDAVDPVWEAGTIAFDSDPVPAEVPTKLTLSLTRPSPGPVPSSILLVSNALTAEMLVARAAESRNPIVATIVHVCE